MVARLTPKRCPSSPSEGSDAPERAMVSASISDRILSMTK
jgi:hypothetical protein